MIRFKKPLQLSCKKLIEFAKSNYLILLFSLTVGLKLSIFNYYITKALPAEQVWPVIIFDFASAIGIFSLLYPFKKYKNKLAITFNGLISLILIVDTVYLSYFDSLPTIGIFSSASQAGDVMPAIIILINWKLSLYFTDIITALIFIKYLGRKKHKKTTIKLNKAAPWMATFVSLNIFFLALTQIGAVRLAISFNNGFDALTTSNYYGVLGAHLIDTSRFFNQLTSKISEEKKESIINWVINNNTPQNNTPMTGVANGKNIIMIQVESLGGFVINQTINNQEITPTLNKLSATSQFFPNDNFIIGAGHTSDTDFVANSSYLPLSDAAVFIRYGHNNFTSLPKTLINNGYSAFAYHGYTRNFWNRDVALSSLGYQKFYAADNYPKGEMINMGLNDGDFLMKTAEYINNQPKPSLSYVITLSSHTGFEITDLTQGLNLDPDDYPSQVGGYLQDINYVDRMLDKFFISLKSNNLFDDSLIVIYGDHTPVLPAFKAGSIEYNPDSNQEREVPLIIKLPNQTNGKTYPETGSHLDIMPTVLDLIGIKTNDLMFGNSLFSTNPINSTLSDDQKIVSDTIIRYNIYSLLTK